jgi:hypothetical protein
MARSHTPLSNAFVSELFRQMQGKNPALALPLTWIEQRLAEHAQSVEGCVELAAQSQAADQVSIGNCIGSLRGLGAIDWQQFVEDLSTVDRTLRTDPAGIYESMDFATRDRYRHVIEDIVNRSKRDENEVAVRVPVTAVPVSTASGRIPVRPIRTASYGSHGTTSTTNSRGSMPVAEILMIVSPSTLMSVAPGV